MLAGYKRKTNIGLGSGFLLVMFGSGFLSAAKESPGGAVLPILALLAFLSGVVLFIRGCCANAKGKGYPTALGAIGVLGLLGLIVLACLPDRFKCCETGGPDCTHGRKPVRNGKDWSSRAA